MALRLAVQKRRSGNRSRIKTEISRIVGRDFALSNAGLLLDHELPGSYSRPEVGFEELATDLREARFGTANEALADALITAALPTIRPEFGGGEGPAPLGPARYTVARKILVNGTKISVKLSDL